MSGLSKAYQEAMDKIDGKVEEAIKQDGANRHYVMYSAYDFDQWETPIDNLDEVPVKGKIRFESEDGEWKSGVLESPTWLEITVVANHMIIETGDYHHVYVEDFDVIANEDGIMIARLFMGS